MSRYHANPPRPRIHKRRLIKRVVGLPVLAVGFGITLGLETMLELCWRARHHFRVPSINRVSPLDPDSPTDWPLEGPR